MPRMNLTDEETKLILRQREVEEAHRAGWNKALYRIKEQCMGPEQMLNNDVIAFIETLERLER